MSALKLPKSPAKSSPSQESSASIGVAFGSTLGGLLLAIGLGAVGAYMLDLHGHTCEKCGRRWRHFGAFNLGDESSHTCARCGEVQWWKCGAPHVLRGSEFAAPAAAPFTPQGLISSAVSSRLAPPVSVSARQALPTFSSSGLCAKRLLKDQII